MKKLKNIVIFIVLITLSYVLIYCSHIRFSIADDYLLNNIISGTFGNTYDYQLLYINNILGIILKLLYKVIPVINIYTLYLLITLCVCYTIIVKNVLKKRQYIMLPIIFILYLLTLYNITYTIIAYLSAAVGILELVSEKKKNIYAGNILTINGCLLRNQVIMPVLVVLGPILLFDIIKKKKYKKIINISILLITIVILNIVGNLMYKTNSELNEFKKWQDASIKIRDYASIDYEKYKDILERENWSENDLKLFYTWNFADKDKFTTQSMENIADSIKIEDRYNLNIQKIIRNFIEQYTKSENKLNNIYIIIFILTFIIAIIKSENKKSILYVFLATIGINIMLIIRDRIPYRVIFPQYLIAIIYYIYEIKTKIEDNKKVKIVLWTSSLIIVSIFSIKYIQKFNKEFLDYDVMQNKNMRVIEYLKNNQNNFYILDSSTYNNLTMNYKITERRKIGEYKNIIKSGGGDCFSNRYYNCLNRFELKEKNNLYKNLLQNNVYYMGNTSDILQKYLKDNVDEKAKFIEYEKINDMIIYKFINQ